MVYRCPSCSEKEKTIKLIFFRKTELKEQKNHGKFKASRLATLKLVNLVSRMNGYEDTPLPRNQFCIYCKEKLSYDKEASLTRTEERLQVKSWYHFDCKNNDDKEIMFTFIRGKTDGIEIIRMIQG